MSEYLVIYEQAPDGAWGASLPDLPGVFALGRTKREVDRRIKEAAAAYAAASHGDGADLPAPSHEAGRTSL